MYGIVRGGRLHRLTFSRAVALECLRHLENSYKLQEFKAIMGHRLPKGEASPNGLYGICSERSKKLLRVSLIKEQAEFYLDDSRYLCEIWLKEI